MQLEPIDLAHCKRVGRGVQRPEDVVVSCDGRVWLSDQASACAEVLADGSLRRVGAAGGAPNGINMDRAGRIVIANYGHGYGRGPLQRLDPATGVIEVLAEQLDGRPLVTCNYPVIDSQDRIWCTHSTWGGEEFGADSPRDGLVFRVDPDGSVHTMASGLDFANGCALDAAEQYLYVCETVGCDVQRFPLRADGTLGAPERYGPKLGYAAHEVQHLRPLSLATRSQLGLTDGCGFDAAGNLWVTLVMANKVVAITPAGDVVTMLSDPAGAVMQAPTNVSWGGPDLTDLYIGSVRSDYVVKVKSPIPGMPLVHQRRADQHA
ncbi:MAG: SMP-30/gluconolactonase/LRE family protein [Gammaproteobacteria bacterium]